MNNNVMFFAIHVDDTERAKRFYENVFDWKFQPWGPPGFFLITTGKPEDPGIAGALHKRMEPRTGTGMNGFECSVAVADLGKTLNLVTKHGGEIVMQRVAIPTVGELFKFHDPEGNLVVAIQYEAKAWREMKAKGSTL